MDIEYEEDDDGFYLIKNIEQLQNIRENPDGNYRLACDIDASKTRKWNRTFTSDWKNKFMKYKGFDPIEEFTGVFDGDGHEIKNLYINNETEIDIGIIKDNEGTIKNLTMKNIDFRGNGVTGGIVGENRTDGIIRNCTVKNGNITSQTYTGGIVGKNTGKVIKSSAFIFIECRNYSGGIVGRNSGLVKSSSFNGIILGNLGIGGIVGSNDGEIIFCYTDSSLIRGPLSSGILIGLNDGLLDHCYWVSKDVDREQDPIGNNKTGQVGDIGYKENVEQIKTSITVNRI